MRRAPGRTLHAGCSIARGSKPPRYGAAWHPLPSLPQQAHKFTKILPVARIFQPASCILPPQFITMLSRLSYLYRAWRYRFRVDPAEIHYLLSTLRPGDTAVDIGCHKGGYLYWMRRRVGLHGRVYAFEPQPRLFEYLTVIQKQLNFNNVQLENMGLSSQTGSMTLHIPASSSGTSPGATLNAVTESNPTDFHHHTVQVSTLDAYFHAQGIRPALLKIDVEGHEWELLKGGQALLEACRPRILMECENRHLGGGDVQDVFRFLLDLGYAGRFIHKGKLRPLAEFDAAIHQHQGPGRFWEAPDYVNNFVFE